MKQNFSLYFLAIIPPEPIRSQVRQFKEYITANYGSKASLRSPPHITLYMPFRFSNKREEQLTGKLESFTQNLETTEISLDNFGCFPPKIIYIQVAENPDLNNIQSQLDSFLRRELGVFNDLRGTRPFRPHVTIAFRDLKKSAFKDAWSEFSSKNYTGKFLCQNITLLKHNGKYWDEHYCFGFASPSSSG